MFNPSPLNRRSLHVTALILFAGILFQLFPASLQAQNVTEYAKIDSLSVGDRVSYAITLSKDQPYEEVIFPDSSSFGSSFEIRSLQRFQVTEFKDSLVYDLQFFGTEETRIPELPVKLVSSNDTTVLYTNPVPVPFRTVLQSDQETLRPLKPIFDFAAAWWPYIVALLLLGAAAWYLYKLYNEKALEPKPVKKKQAYSPTPFQDPLHRLGNILSQLKGYTFSSEKDFEVFYVNLGDAIREYFEDLYRIPALESTSREILYELSRRSVDSELIEKTKAVLQEADMVKFAKFTPTEEQAEKALKKADAFLERAREVDKPRVEHLRRKHQQKNEEKRKAFEESQNSEVERV
ncbi:MAG TPA: hypothetical protein VJ905_03470 [Halalkalibaculum sp.]|nr:hypothetical protein [Clostridia bacterium]HKL17995.1 hypothetical protein [Halalkalibaculum sp.]